MMDLERLRWVRTTFLFVAGVALSCHARDEAPAQVGPGTSPGTSHEPLHVFVGSHTQPEIAHLLLNAEGGLVFQERVATGKFPRALAWHAGADVLYAVNDRSFQLAAFHLDRMAGVLVPMGQTPDGEHGLVDGGISWPINLALHPSGKWLLVGRHLEDGNSGMSAHELDASGRWTGRSVDARLACDDNANFNVAFDPAGRFAYGACDGEGLYRFRFDEDTGDSAHVGLDNTLKSANATDLIFAAGSRTAYLYQAGNVSALILDHTPDTGDLTYEIGNLVRFEVEGSAPLRTPRPAFDAPLYGRMTQDPEGKFIYAALPEQNAIGIDKVGTPGLRRLSQIVRAQGNELRRPLHAVRSPVGPWLLVASEETGTVAVYATSPDASLTLVGPPLSVVEGASFIAIAHPPRTTP